MSEKSKNITVTFALAAFLSLFFIWCLSKPTDAFSDSERRPLAAMPSPSKASLLSGDFMQDFEDHASDQFPLRDRFRALKAFASFRLFGQKDMNGIYTADGYVSKLEYPLNTDSLDNAAGKFREIYHKYLEQCDGDVYLSIVPDKNYFMAAPNGYPAMDYDGLAAYLKEGTQYMQYIDIFGNLELSDYYKTDTHWRQEKITDVAQRLAEGMGNPLSGHLAKALDEGYTVKALDEPFYGVYYGQSALPLPAEQMYYLDSQILDACQVYDHETNSAIPVYDTEKASGKDPYEMFLGGPKALLTVKNPNAATDKRLVIFRDSFGSSLAPLLFEGYAEVTLIDIRYLPSAMLGNFVDFQGCDVLFLYSTLVLNNSITLK